MTVLVTLTTAGTDTGPFDLFSDSDGYASAFELEISKAFLLFGYPSSNVPDDATNIMIKSQGGLCMNYVIVPIPTTTTTSTTTACPDSYSYNINIYDCGVCTLDGGGSFDNLYPLTVGKFYYYPLLNAVIEILSYIGCGGVPVGDAILDIDQQDNCIGITCPTTTTTTTL